MPVATTLLSLALCGAPALPPRGAPTPAPIRQRAAVGIHDAAVDELLPGTRALDFEGDLAHRMVSELRDFLLARTAERVAARRAADRTERTEGGRTAQSADLLRERLAELLGVLRPPLAHTGGFTVVVDSHHPTPVVAHDGFEVREVRWPVFEDADGRGLWLRPTAQVGAQVVLIPDAGQALEPVCGIGEQTAGGGPAWAAELARRGCEVVVVQTVDRGPHDADDRPALRGSGHSRREWLWRQAYELGRHPLGYEVESVLAALDVLQRGTRQGGAQQGGAPEKLAVAGYGEGGRAALMAGALDPRVEATWVAGAFGEQDAMWQDPIDRDLWRYLVDFGDARVASLVAPRALIVEACASPVTEKVGSTPGVLRAIDRAAAQRELDRAAPAWGAAGEPPWLLGDGTGPVGSPAARAAFLSALGLEDRDLPPLRWTAERPTPASAPRGREQLRDWVEHTQSLMRAARSRRAGFWSALDLSSPEAYERSLAAPRARFAEELIGLAPPPSAPPDPRSRLTHEQPTWLGYRVVLEVWPGVIASGTLCLPRDLQPGERRPVVVCQHGLEGRDDDVVDPGDTRYYRSYGARLAERGFIVFAPQNPYLGGDHFRELVRMGHPLGLTLFSLITRQHERILQWLGAQPYVDPARIAFYGLSYGGKTAMRVPSQLPGYCLSICSADFNEWLVKCATVDSPYSYLYTGEYDMVEWDLGHSFNYAEMAALIAPRPFMVERGHHDGVAPDEWVAAEFSRVRRLYAALDLPERTEIEFFDGPHEIHGEGTFEFLHRCLDWPEPDRR